MKIYSMRCLLLIVVSTLAVQFAIAAETNPFLLKQKAFNELIYNAHSENVRIARRGSFTRANFAITDQTQSDEQIIAMLVEKRILPAAQVACRRQIEKCAAAIAKKDISVLPKISFNGVMQISEEFKSWNLSSIWVTELVKIEGLLNEHLGHNFDEYVIGYNDGSEIFNFILLSKDRTRAIVLIGDVAIK